MDTIDQYIPIAVFVLNGLIAGWLASRIFGGLGFFRNLIIGILGSLLAGYAIRTKTIEPPVLFNAPFLDQIAYSTFGAFLIIIMARVLSRR